MTKPRGQTATPWPRIPKARAARRALQDALDALRATGERTPCTGPNRDDWTSESPRARARAAIACGPCPVFGLCSDVANSERPTAGVYAGRPRVQRARTPRKEPR